MALAVVKVQGSDGGTQDVLVDTITGQTYAMPIYKLAIGATSIDDGVISSDNLLPVSVLNPRSAFGEISVAQHTPVVQVQFPYNINEEILVERSNNGASSVANDKLKVSTGAAANQSSQVMTKALVKYNPGQGGLVRFTALFTTGVAGSTQYIGLGGAGDGYFFGFSGTSFGVLRRRGGTPEVRILEITTGSTTAEDVTITLDGDAKTDVAVTNTGNITLTANEIAAADYSAVGRGWDAHVMGENVFFESYDAAAGKTGTYSLSSATTAVGAFSQDLAGSAPTEEFIAKEDFNVDVLDGTGKYQEVFDTTKGNVFEVRYQWLGFGAIDFSVEDPVSGLFNLVHIIRYANANTLPSISNPSLPIVAMVENTTNDSDVVLESSSMAGFIEGLNEELGVTHAKVVEAASIGTTETPILSIHNHSLFQSKINRVIVFIDNIDVSVDGTKPAAIRVRLNADLTGASFTTHSANTSVIFIDTSATAVSGGDIEAAKPVQKAGTIELLFQNLLIFPGDTLTVSVEASSGTTDTVGSIDWTERL